MLRRALSRSWFLSLPIVVVIAHGSSPWVRKIATESIYVITICLGYVLIPALLAPSKVRGCLPIGYEPLAVQP